MDPVEVELPTYRVLIARGALAEVGRIAAASARAHRYAIVSDESQRAEERLSILRIELERVAAVRVRLLVTRERGEAETHA